MSEEQFKALLTKLKADSIFKEKLLGATDLDAALALAKEAGFEIGKEDWVNKEALVRQAYSLSDEDLESVSGGTISPAPPTNILFWTFKDLSGDDRCL
jgi:predicted ribosomally synthesized peptide with nif11-like leader